MSRDLRRKVYLFKAAPEEDLSPATKGSCSSDGRKELNETEIQQQHQEQEKASTGGKTVTTAGWDLKVIDDGEKKNEERDRFITLLREEGVCSELIPVLVFQYSNKDNLWRHLKDPGKYAGLIFTSQRCVYSIKEVLTDFDTSNEWTGGSGLGKEWASKYMFSVGPSTSSKIHQLFASVPEGSLKVIQGKESHAESLADTIIEVCSRDNSTLPFLYPCGSLRRDVLLKKLQAAGLHCDACVAYETIENPSLATLLEERLVEIKRCNSFLCFFSPSGVKFVLQHFDDSILCCDTVNFVAIGPTTKTALEEALSSRGVPKPIHTCQSPTPESLLEIVKQL